MDSEKLSKGFQMEESLRSYLLKSGYYVVRGVPFKYKEFDITDVDLWLYARPSPVSREISIVDIKNKRTPQAIERIFWVKGLQESISADKAIVATTDRRPEVKEFGKTLDVFVLDGDFLSRLTNKEQVKNPRLSDEEFYDLFKAYKFEKFDGDWKKRITNAKSHLIDSDGLGFNSCLDWIKDAQFFGEQSIIHIKHSVLTARCFYLLCSFIAISVDYILKDYAFLTAEARTKKLAEGFTFGDNGSESFKTNLKTATMLISAYHENGKTIKNQIENTIQEELSSLRTGSLAEFFSKSDVAKNLFSVGVELESLAYQKVFSSHTEGSNELRAFVGCILDYIKVDRVEFNKSTTFNNNRPSQQDLNLV